MRLPGPRVSCAAVFLKHTQIYARAGVVLSTLRAVFVENKSLKRHEIQTEKAFSSPVTVQKRDRLRIVCGMWVQKLQMCEEERIETELL